jgi:hypothetical protein
MKNTIWTALLTVSAATSLSAQPPVVITSGKRTIEVLGLQKWTIRMLEDSISRYAPGQTLGDAACMATLRYKLGFQDALVRRHTGIDRFDPEKQFVSVRVVEPTNRQIWRKTSAEKFESLLPEYAPLILPVTDTTGGVWTVRLIFGYQFSDSTTRAEMLASTDSLARRDYARVEQFLATQQSVAHRERAIRVLDSSAAPANRMAAALILLKHSNDEDARFALVRALRDPHESVRGIAGVSLSYFPARRIDWAPLISDLRALLNGANLGETERVMRMLIETGADARLAKPLLNNNGQWVIRLLQSKAPMSASTARQFLTVLNGGVDLGASVEAWRGWVGRL